MQIVLAGLLAVVHAVGASGSALQSALQKMLTNLTATQGSNLTLQLGWASANESFSVAAGTVINPGESERTVTADDTYNYGSGTKAVVATAVMRMVDAGKVQLDDKVSAYVNPFLERNNGTTLEQLFGPTLANATVLQVIRMEAGIPDFEAYSHGGESIDSQALMSHGEVFSPYAWMRAAANNTPPCIPGNCSYYSSTSYEVAGLLLAAVQSPNGDYGDLNFGAALSDDASRYPSIKLPGSDGKLRDTISVAGFARGYMHSSTEQVVIYDQNPTIMGWSCGGVNMNTRDFAKFFYDLLDESSPHPLVSATSRAEMTNVKRMTAGHFKPPYGAGLMTSTTSRNYSAQGPDDWGYLIGHIGSTFAFHATNGYMPKAKAAISVVTNSDSGRSLTQTAACQATEIAANFLDGVTLDLSCFSHPSYSRRRRSVIV